MEFHSILNTPNFTQGNKRWEFLSGCLQWGDWPRLLVVIHQLCYAKARWFIAWHCNCFGGTIHLTLDVASDMKTEISNSLELLGALHIFDRCLLSVTEINRFGFDDGPNCSHNAFYDYLASQKQKASKSFDFTDSILLFIRISFSNVLYRKQRAWLAFGGPTRAIRW